MKDIRQLIRESGAVGAGGAGFPAWAKFSADAEILLINGAECEPLLYTDYYILKEERQTVFAGAEALLDSGEGREAILALETRKGELLSLYDGQKLTPRLTVRLLPDAYPMGDEVSLVLEATGRTVPPGKLPLSVGVVVRNVETVWNLGRALTEGKPVCDSWITVCGDLPESYTLRVPVGTPVRDILTHLSLSVPEGDLVLDGGPAMGKIIDPDTAVITKTTKAITVLPRSCTASRSHLKNAEVSLRLAASACCQCTRCTDMCPRYLLGYPLAPHLMVRAGVKGGQIDPRLLATAQLCCGCGLCETVACCQGISPKAVIDSYKEILRQSGTRYQDEAPVSPRADRAFRILPAHRFAEHMGVARYHRIPLRPRERMIPSRVEIPLGRQIGAPSVPAVSVGDTVRRGQVIATAAEGLSVPQHASICGTVRAVTSTSITIEREG